MLFVNKNEMDNNQNTTHREICFSSYRPEEPTQHFMSLFSFHGSEIVKIGSIEFGQENPDPEIFMWGNVLFEGEYCDIVHENKWKNDLSTSEKQ